MPCPLCEGELEPASRRHGIVWLCRSCRAGAATLPILRQVAPREFVNHLWQAALQDGIESPRRCPSCTQPFTCFSGSRVEVEPRLEVCTRCFWVWLHPASLVRLAPILAPSGAALLATRLASHSTASTLAPGQGEASRALCRLAAGVVLDALA
jgi:hypothetical protein